VTTFTQRVPVDRIDQRARAAQPGRVALTVIVSVLFSVGWLVARTLSVLWIGLAWSASAVAEGWAAGRSAEWTRHVEARRAASAGRPG
jgi:Tfp pilus assembly protein PilW